MNDKRNLLHWVIGPALGLLGLGLYLLTLSRGPYPGESAALMVRELGLDVFQGGSHPVWHWLTGLVAWLPFGELAFRLNALSAVCGALALWLFARVVTDAVWLVAEVNETNRRAVDTASILAGLVAGIALMGSMPFWYASNRYHLASFDILLMVALARLFLSFARDGSAWRGVVFALCYGVGVVETATLIVMAPLAGIGVLYVLWFHGELRWSRILALMGTGLGGMLLYGVSAWQMARSDEFLLTVEGNFWTALYYVWRSQYILIVRSLPELGWLLVILVGIVPWLAVLAVARRGLNEEKDWGFFALHAILTGVTVAVLFNARFAPWAMLGTYRLLVTPYLLMAFCLGYLAAYWCLLPRMWGQNAEPYERGRIWVRDHAGTVLATLLLGAAVAAGTLNYQKADARGAGPINRYAHEVVEAMGGREWLVSDGALDQNLILAAKQAGIPLRVLNMKLGNNTTYMRYVAKQFDNPRLKTLAEVDALAFLREWMAADAQFAAKVALLTLPDLWLAAGFQPIPDRLIFTGARALADVDAEALWTRNQAFWKSEVLTQLEQVRQNDPMLGGYASSALRHVGMVANNLGVVMEDAGRKPEAYAAYAQSRLVDPGNISALLNQAAMIREGYAAPDAATVTASLKELGANLKQKLQIWSLSRYYGYVRSPDAFANLGMVWALSGQPGMAVAGFKRAIELAPGRRDQLTAGLAMAYMAQDKSEEGEALYREMLAKSPTNGMALVMLARLKARQNQFDEAAKLLQRAGEAGVAKAGIAIEYAAMYMAAGQPEKARVVLQELVDVQPEMSSAWAMLAGVLMQMGDTKALAECERRLERARGKDFLTTVVLGQIALNRGDVAGARNYLDAALGLRPNTPVLLDLLLRLDVQEGRKDLAAQHIRSLLLLDPEHAFANQVLASLQTERKEYALAENSLRRSLARDRTPIALNDLAWVLQQRGDLDEAETLVREALKANPRQYTFWDTLGTVLIKRNQFAEAEEALKKALSLFAENPTVQVHMAELFDKKGETAKAKALAEDLLGRAGNLSSEDQETLRKIACRPSVR